MCEFIIKLSMNLWKTVCLVLLITLVCSTTGNTTVNPSLEKLIEVSPNSLDVLLHAFDNIIIYFHSKDSQEDL